MTRARTASLALGAAAVMAVAACSFEERHAMEPPNGHGAAAAHEAPDTTAGHATAAPAEAGATGDSAAVPDTSDRIQPGVLRTVTAAPVTDWLGPDGKPFEVEIRTADPSTANVRRFGTITMRNSARERAPDLGMYPCTSCHLGRGTVLRDERIKDAHQNIQVEHPRQTGATCATCHAPDNVELLALKSGERATLDHTYRLCAQCHFSQAESWAGGAHGKRLDGWQGRRVVMGCADCHDPHRPGLDKRVPFRAPTLKRPPLDQP